MRLIKVQSYYKDALQYYYNKFPEYKYKSYDEQYQHLISQRYGWSDFYKRAFEQKNITAWEIIFNAEYLQKKWAEENNISSRGFDLLLEQFRLFKPDIVWFQDSFSFSKEFIANLKKQIPSIKVLIGNCCSPYTEQNIETLKMFDFVTTCSPAFIEMFEKNSISYLKLYHAFDPIIFEETKSDSKEIDFIFVGSVIPKKGFHMKRIEFLENLAEIEKLHLKFFGNISNSKYSAILKEQISYVLNKILKKTKTEKYFKNSTKVKKIKNVDTFTKYKRISPKLMKKYFGPLYGIDMYKEMAKSKITIDVQGEIHRNYAGNMRLFEATGMGLVLLVEDKSNITEIFEPDKEIVVFKSFDQAVEKIEWLINNEEERKKIANAAQKKVFEKHTYINRVDLLIEKINQILKSQ